LLETIEQIKQRKD